MQVKSIAECSKESILQYFRPSLSYHLPLTMFKWPLKTGFTVLATSLENNACYTLFVFCLLLGSMQTQGRIPLAYCCQPHDFFHVASCYNNQQTETCARSGQYFIVDLQGGKDSVHGSLRKLCRPNAWISLTFISGACIRETSPYKCDPHIYEFD